MPAPTLAAQPTALRYAIGDTVSETLPAGVGAAPFTYALTDRAGQAVDQALPGLAFEVASGVLSGSPTQNGSAALTYTATDKYGNATAEVMFGVLVGRAFAGLIGDETYTAGATVALTLPPIAAGGAANYALVGSQGAALPAGLAFTAANRALAGSPTEAGAFTLIYTASDGGSEVARATLVVTVRHSLPNPGPQTYFAEVDITALTLAPAVGGGALSYALLGAGPAATAPNLPAGFGFRCRRASVERHAGHRWGVHPHLHRKRGRRSGGHDHIHGHCKPRIAKSAGAAKLSGGRGAG